MASVYAPSTIHSKSTLSRKYEVDTSAMFNMGEQFRANNANEGQTTFNQLLQQFSLDIGRFDYRYGWINKLRLVIFPFFLLLSSMGLTLIDYPSMSDSVILGVYRALYYIMVFIPEDLQFNMSLAIVLCVLFLYITLIIFMVYLMKTYKDDSCPTTFAITLWVTLSRIILPIFSTFVANLLSRYLCYIIIEATIESVVLFILSIPLLMIQFIYIFLSCSVYNATPIIRNNDITQTWYSYSRLDWQLNLVLFMQVFLQNMLGLAAGSIACIAFTTVITVLCIGFAFLIFFQLPYVSPTTNATVFSSALAGPFMAVTPVIGCYLPGAMLYLLIIQIVLIVILMYAGRFIINERLKYIMRKFDVLHEKDDDNEDQSEFDPLSAAFQTANPVRAICFPKLNLKSEKKLSLALRVGYLFKQEEVENQLYIKWAIEQNSKADIILSSCQVSYSLQNDVRMLNTLEQLCHKLGSAPFNSQSFVVLFNHLRQELLTQLNTPLLEAVNLAKKSNHILQSTISEFWGAVLKQKSNTMADLLPYITKNMTKTEVLFGRLMRNYPRASIIYRETVLFYHKTVGDHYKTMECQGKYNRTRGSANGMEELSSESNTSMTESSTSYGDVDNDFKERMEPWLAAQDVVKTLSSPPLKWMNFLIIMSFVICIALPSTILGILLYDIQDFQDLLAPVQTLSNLQYAMTRIPQLIRRKQLLEIGEVHFPPVDIFGPPMGRQNEFLLDQEIIPSVQKYINIMKTGIDSYLQLCRPDNNFYSVCVDRSNIVLIGNMTTNSTIYDMLSQFQNSAASIISSPTFDYTKANETTDLLYLYQNFDSLFHALSNALAVLGNQILTSSIYFNKISDISLILTWVLPIVLISIFTVIVISVFNKEVVFMMRLFFQISKSEISNLRWSMKQKKTKNISHKQQNQLPSSQTLNSSTDSLTGTQYKNESMADVLATTPHEATGLYGKFIEALVIFVLFTCLMTSIGIIVFKTSMITMIDMSSGNVLAIDVSSGALASYVWTQEIFSLVPVLYTRDQLKEKTNKYIVDLVTMFNEFLYGSNKTTREPGIFLGEDVIKAYIQSKTVNQTGMTYDIEPCYGFMHAVYFSLSCDSQMRLLDEATSYITSNRPDAIQFNFQDEFVYHYEHLLFSHLDLFLSNGRQLFADKTEESNRTKIYQILLVFIIMFMIQILFFFTILLIQFFNLKKNIYTPRNLMQLVTPDALLKSHTLIKWLSGVLTCNSHSSHILDSNNTSKAQQADFVVQHSKCGLMLADSLLHITKVNQALLTLFKTDEEAVINSTLIDFFKGHLIDKNKENIIQKIEKHTKKMRYGQSQNNKLNLYSTIIDQNSQLMYISIFIEGHSDDDALPEGNELAPPARSFSIVINDRTTEHFQEALVESEKKKSENLIDSLMPPSIAKRLNDGETDISFEVQKATILFSSIVNMNEVINNMSAIQVMGFLNKLYSAYDIELSNFPSVTKLKTIGHIYMIAAGLFTDSSVNSAQVCTDYAIRMIQIAEQLSVELSIPFQITIGLNTGGPINCGILGVTRPVFDIIGDAVNVSSRMNSNGIPGLIRIPESTYEDIKFLKYYIKERGEIQVKGKGLRKTYLVSPNPLT